MKTMLQRLVREDESQDLVEYALLIAFFVLAAIVVWQAIAGAVGIAYVGYDSDVQGLWSPCDPGVRAPC